MRFLRRRGVYKHLYIIGLFLVGLYYFTRVSSSNKDEGGKDPDWADVKKKAHSDDKDLTYDGPFPDSGVVPGEKQELKDWHNYEKQREDALKTGPGEQGAPHNLKEGLEKERHDLWNTNGFNALLSDEISVDRSLRDIRHTGCKSKKYKAKLPTVSVVIPFFEEHWTTLLRTVKSVVNRSPSNILKEIILVDDGSSIKDFLKEPLDKYLAEHAPMTQVVRLKERVGLIQARQEGAMVATADVIVVLDSHVEVMTNWLPPLLDPIAEDWRTVVCPLIDVVNKDNFGYYPQDNGGRGAFDWRFFYKRLPLYEKDEANLPEPFENPVMNGGLFAMSRKFFWELGGYDLGIKIWGGEQYDLSFKIWQCHGRMFDAPCSRVGHIFRDAPPGRPSVKGDFLSVNYKRVAEVWMDDYKEALYRRNKHLREVDVGDITKELEIRKRLQCKPFKWYLETVAPDLVARYPPVEPPDFANGTIKSVANPSLCMDNGAKENGDIILYPCHGLGTQYFALSWLKSIRIDSEQFCWQSAGVLGHPPHQAHCHQGEQPPMFTWRYDPDTRLLKTKHNNWCVEADVATQKVKMAVCDLTNTNQQWIYQFVNKKLIDAEYPPF